MAGAIYWVGSNGNAYVKGAGGNNAAVTEYTGISGAGSNGFSGLMNGVQGQDVQATQVADPNAPLTQLTGSGSSGGGGSGGSTTAAPDLSSYDQSIDATNDQLNNLTPSLSNALAGDADQYQTAINQLNQQNALTGQTYNTDKTNDQQDYVTGKNQINTNTGNTINGLDRLLASRGAAGESAGDYGALLAAGQGTQQLSSAGTTFGKNQQALDTNYNNYENTYNQDLTGESQQKQQADQQAQVSYDTNRANLLQSLASLVNERTSAAGGHGVAASQPYVTQAQSLLQAAGNIKPIAVAAQTPLTYTAPTLASYTTNPTTVAAASPSASAATDSAIPYLSLLDNRQQQNATGQ